MARRRRPAHRGDRRLVVLLDPFPDRRLSRSAYEQVFLKLVSGGRLRIGSEIYRPIGMKGWYHAVFRRDSDGAILADTRPSPLPDRLHHRHATPHLCCAIRNGRSA